MTTTRLFVLNTELAWTINRMACFAVHEVCDAGGEAFTPGDLVDQLHGYKGALAIIEREAIARMVDALISNEAMCINDAGQLELTHKGQHLLEGRYLGCTDWLVTR